MRRRAFVALMPNIIVAPRLAFAQQLTKVARIGFLGPTPAASVAPRVEALRVGLLDLGYAEGKNLIFEFRWAATPDQMPALVADLIRAGADVIVALSSLETAAALATTKTVPVVFTTHADPVGLGHVASLARPGGNATGLTMLLTDLVGKELEVLKEALPKARRFGVLFTTAAPSHLPALGAAETAARSLGVELLKVPVRGEEDFPAAFADDGASQRGWLHGACLARFSYRDARFSPISRSDTVFRA